MPTSPVVDYRSKYFMKYLVLFFGAFLPLQALSNPLPPVVPLNQYQAALGYSRNGEQSGCGLRISGETKDDLWISVMVIASMKESGALYGIFKVDAKKIIMKNGRPLIRDGKVMYSSAGRIQEGWIKTDSGSQFLANKNVGSPHIDGYMAPMEFDNAINLLIAIPKVNFRVGFSKNEGETEEVYEFNERITQDEADKLSSCMKNLRDARSGKGL